MPSISLTCFSATLLLELTSKSLHFEMDQYPQHDDIWRIVEAVRNLVHQVLTEARHLIRREVHGEQRAESNAYSSPPVSWSQTRIAAEIKLISTAGSARWIFDGRVDGGRMLKPDYIAQNVGQDHNQAGDARGHRGCLLEGD